MVITYKTVSKLKFPVFLLSSSNWHLADGLLFLDEKLLDDRNMPGDTLGIRRAQSPHREQYPLKRAVFNHNGLLKQYTKCFIDSNGAPFIYEKTKSMPLKYLRIKKVIKKEVASLLWVEGCSHPFTIPRPPEQGMNWAGILHLHGLPWMLYEYSETKQKNTHRKV
jgi:hypothetical protein